MRPLELVELISPADTLVDGLVPVRDSAAAESPHERAVLLQAAAFDHVDYVFFRRYAATDGGDPPSSHVAAYVVDNARHGLTEEQVAALHHKLWLHGIAPLVYVAWPTRIDILTCAREPDFWQASPDGASVTYRPADRIESPPAASGLVTGARAIKDAARIADSFEQKRRRYSAHRLAEGTFWDDPASRKLARHDAAAHQSLIRAVVEADRALAGETHPVRRRLLVLVILIKYLEDRGVFPPGLFGRFHAGARSVRDIFRDGTSAEVLRLLAYFERKFNGDVFSIGPDADRLTETEFRRVARLVAANELGGRLHFWELFSFEYIPVEVISRLYQHFVTARGAVYTPPVLASLLLDRAMPYDRMTGEERVLDPSCGSGVFLVGAFNRLVVNWRSRHDWGRPGVDDLKRILAKSVHGVELEAGAVDLTAFSLALAVCDALDPPVIWRDLTFDKLRGRNLRVGDFFDPATVSDHDGHEWPGTFDVVIGNPPFDSTLTPAAAVVDSTRPAGQPKLPDTQAAYFFLERGLMSLSPGGSLCMIQPHGLIYNTNPAEFRRHLMRLCPVHAVLDFVSIRGLYEAADPKTIAWHAVQAPPADRPVHHLAFRRTYAAAEKIAFEIDHYDYHALPRDLAETDPFVWRLGLLGGGRLNDVVARYRRMPTLGLTVGQRGWKYGEGFNVGNRAKKADFLTGKAFLPTAAFTLDGIDVGQIRPLEETHFERPHEIELYTPPLILIKEHASLPVAFWEGAVLTYQHKIVGIHSPPEGRPELLAIYAMLNDNKRFYQFYCMLAGTQALIGKATAINKRDIDQLPLPADASELELAFWEEVLRDDVLDYMADYVRLGQDSVLLKQSAGLDELAAYSSLLVRMLGTLYRGLKAHDPVFLNGLIAQPFFYGDRPDVTWLGDECEAALHKLVYDESREVLRTVRVVRYYGGNVILIVKPDRLRYWIRSTAIRDADDTLAELREQGW